MITEEEVPRIQYKQAYDIGDVVPFPYSYSDKSQVYAIKNNTPMVLDTDYTVSLSQTITVLIPFLATDTLTIYRKTKLDNQSNFPQDAKFNSAKLNSVIDKITMQQQEQAENISRSIKLPINAPTSVQDLEIPLPVPNKGLKWNPDGTALVNSDFDPDEAVDITTEQAQIATAAAALAQAATGAIPSPIGEGGNYLKQKITEDGFEYGDLKTDLGLPNSVNNTYWKRDSSGVLINMTPEQIREDIDPNVNHMGDIITNPSNFSLDNNNKGYVRASITPEFPSAPAGKMKMILWDFNIEPGRSITWPANVKWEYGVAPALSVYPLLSLTVATISNMILTFTGVTTQKADLANVPFNNVGTNEWEIIWYVTPTQVGVIQTIMGGSGSAYAPQLNITAANKLALYLSSNNTSYDIANGTLGTYVVTNSTPFYVKKSYIGGHYKVETSADGVTWTTDQDITSLLTINSSTLTGNIRLGANYANTTWLKGTIDLIKSSVKILGAMIPRSMLLPPVDFFGDTVTFLNTVILRTVNSGYTYRAEYSQGTL